MRGAESHATRREDRDHHRGRQWHGRRGSQTVRPRGLQSGRRRPDRRSRGGSRRRDRYVHADVTSEQAWASLVDETLDKFGALDILVNNAGLSSSFVQDDDDFDAWQKLLDVNLNGVYLGTRAVLPVMKNSGAGTIVNISSISGFVGSAGGHPGYFASKGGVRIYTKAMAFKHGPDGIRVNSVHPGVMPPMRSAAAFGAPASASPRANRLIRMIPLRRKGEPIDVAYAVLFLASDEAAYITGTELIVDGGMLCGYGGYPDPED